MARARRERSDIAPEVARSFRRVDFLVRTFTPQTIAHLCALYIFWTVFPDKHQSVAVLSFMFSSSMASVTHVTLPNFWCDPLWVNDKSWLITSPFVAMACSQLDEIVQIAGLSNQLEFGTVPAKQRL
jgi:hypothetical protein